MKRRNLIMKRIERRLLAILLAIFQIVSLIPSTALAETKQIVASTEFSGTMNDLTGNYWVVLGHWESGAMSAGALNKNSQTTYYSPNLEENDFEWVILKKADSESAALGQGTEDIVRIIPSDYGGEKLTADMEDGKYSVELVSLGNSNYKFVFTRKQVPQGDAFKANINFYDFNDSTLVAAPALQENKKYYLIVACNSGSWDSIGSWASNTPWCIQEIDLAGSSSTSVTVDYFSTNNGYYSPQHDPGNGKTYSQLSEEQKSTIKARLVCTSETLSTFGDLQNKAQWQTAIYQSIMNSKPQGFEACGSGNSTHQNGIVYSEDHNYEINFIKAPGRQVNLTVSFEDSEDAIPINTGKYFAVFEATGENNAKYYYTKPISIAQGQASCSLPLEGSWYGNQEFSPNWNVQVKIIKANDGVELTEGGYNPRTSQYTIPDFIEGYSYSVSQEEPYTDLDNHISYYEYVLTLRKVSFSGALSPEDILGDAAEFGIVANRYEQSGHTETNFAVNSFSCNSNIDIDGSGTSAIPFYVGNIDEGSALWLSAGNKVPIDVFIRPEDYTLHNNSTNEYGKIHITSTLPTNVYTKSESEINAYVNGLISAGRATSQAMAGRSIIAPVTGQNNKTVDFTSYPDDITI